MPTLALISIDKPYFPAPSDCPISSRLSFRRNLPMNLTSRPGEISPALNFHADHAQLAVLRLTGRDPISTN